MAILDELADSYVDVRTVVSEKDDEYLELVEVPFESSGYFVENRNDFRIWLMVNGDIDFYKNASVLNIILKSGLFEITTVKKWSKQIYIANRYQEILLGFTPDVCTVRSAIRLIFSILNMIRREDCFGNIVSFIYRVENNVYKIIFTDDFMDTFDQRDISGLKHFLDVICRRDITYREYKKAIDKTSNLIFRTRQKAKTINLC
jgi:hypothetical protein